MQKNKKVSNLRVAFLGRGELGQYVLQGLLDHPKIDVPVIVNCAGSPEVGEKQDKYKKIAAQHDIPFYTTNSVNSAKWVELFSSYDLDLAVAMLWLNTLKEAIISTARLGFINIHGGLLPRYRGNACSNWAILNNETKQGISVHFMDPGKLDSGPVILQEPIPMSEETTIKHLMDHIMTRGGELVLEAVDLIAQGKYSASPQDENKALRCYPRLPRDGEINWEQSAAEIERLIRAAGDPYPGAYSYFADVMDNHTIKKLNIDQARIEEHPTDFCAVPGHLLKLENGRKWAIVCGDMKLLVLEKIRIDGQKVSPGSFFRTVRQRMGLDTETLLKEIKRLSQQQ